jgi:hypothetical protein
MALSDEEKAQLAALMEKEKQADPEDDFEIEIYDGAKGARLPYSKGRSFLQQFGIGLDPDPETESDQGEGDKGGKSSAKSSGGKTDSGKASGTGPKEQEAQGYWSKRTRREAS